MIQLSSSWEQKNPYTEKSAALQLQEVRKFLYPDICDTYRTACLVWCDNSLACLTQLPQGTNCSAKLARHNNQRIRGKPIKFQISSCHRVCDLRYGNPRWKATQRILKACCFIYKAPTFSSLEYVNIEWVRTPWTAEKVKLTLKDWPSHEVLVLPQTHASFRPTSRGVIAISWLLFLWSPNICAIHTHRSIPTAAKVNRNMYKLSFICNFKVVGKGTAWCHVYFLLTLVAWMFWIPLCKNMW